MSVRTSHVRPVPERDQPVDDGAEVGDLAPTPASLHLPQLPRQLLVGEHIKHPAREVAALSMLGQHCVRDIGHDAAEVA